jgi:protein-L-isoaspartate(D-aspartate) O-methyltransferase
MTDMLQLTEDSIVLEIGTGTGYQTAILSCLASQVYSIERIQALAEAARQRLLDMGYDNIEIRCANGYQGWTEKQLKPGGRMVIPIGLPARHQELMLVTRDKLGETHTSSLLAVAFVPMVDEAQRD